MTTWYPELYVLYFDHNDNPVHVFGKRDDGILMCSIMPDNAEPSGHINVARASLVYEKHLQALADDNDQISASHT
jgi:hypothetical protein